MTVTLSLPTNFAATVKYATSNSTALAGSDYMASTGALTFAPGQTSKTFSVSITNDTLDELNEGFKFTLSSPAGVVLGAPSTASLVIVDND